MNRKKTMLWAFLDILLILVVVLEIRTLSGKNTDSADDAVKDDIKYTTEADSGTLIQSEPEPVTPVPTEEPKSVEEEKMSSEEAGQQLENIIQNAAGTWEVYIAHENGDVLFNKDSEEDMRAGDIEYFFMAEQIYEMARDGAADVDEVNRADAVLENKGGESYYDLMDLIYECVDWDYEKKQADRLKDTYPSTFWFSKEMTGYTCAQDGANLLGNIMKNAENGDINAESERNYIKNGWGAGKVTSVLNADGVQVYEVMSEKAVDNRMEDFACVVLPDNTRYVIGIMIKDSADLTEAKEKIGEIAALSYEYYSA